MILKLLQTELDFEIPRETKNVLVKVSGGIDSAICLYLTCKYIKEHTDNSINVYVLTHNDWKKPYQAKFATQVVSWMIDRFPDIKFMDHAKFQIDTGMDYVEGQRLQKIDYMTNLKNNGVSIDVTIHGQNLAPPVDIQKTWIARDGDLLVGPALDDNRNEIQDPWKPEWKMYRPIINLDKQQVAELYNMFDLDDLFNLTRSCENPHPDRTNNFTTHCEDDCWWCYERKWGFGKL